METGRTLTGTRVRGIIELPMAWCGSSELDAASVFEDACHDPVGKLESAAPGSAIHDRRFAGAHGIEKGAQLGA